MLLSCGWCLAHACCGFQVGLPKLDKPLCLVHLGKPLVARSGNYRQLNCPLHPLRVCVFRPSFQPWPSALVAPPCLFFRLLIGPGPADDSILTENQSLFVQDFEHNAAPSSSRESGSPAPQRTFDAANDDAGIFDPIPGIEQSPDNLPVPEISNNRFLLQAQRFGHAYELANPSRSSLAYRELRQRPAKRIFWTEEETGALYVYMELHGLCWSRIKTYDDAELYGQCFLGQRSDVNLKDRARSVKFGLLRNGRKPPNVFNSIRLAPNQCRALDRLRIPY
jgi:hypothetical protein